MMVVIFFDRVGIIALLTDHSFAQLGVLYPSRGGVVEYLIRAYGSGRFSGGCSILFYIAQLIGMAMISLSFGKFAAHLLGIVDDLLFWERVLASCLILSLTLLNLVGSKLVSKVQGLIVIANLTLLSAFAFALLHDAEVARLSVDSWPEVTPIFGSLALTFFAFTGFSVISNTAENMQNPTRDIPRAMYTAITIVIMLYIGLALAIISTVNADELKTSGATLVAVAARSAFGDIGYTALLISAIVSTITCLNGGLFGVTSITFTLAEYGQLPSRFKREIRASTRGLTISALLALLMVNLLSLTTVASLGSATSLLVYSLVNIGALWLVKRKGVHRLLVVLSVIACLFAILVWVLYTLKTSPSSLTIFISFLFIAFASEGLLQRYHRRRLKAQQ